MNTERSDGDDLVDAVRRAVRLPEGEPPAADDIIVRANARALERRTRRRAVIGRIVPWSIAAAATLVLAGQLTRGRPEPAPVSTTVAANGTAEIVTGANELATVHMADGTVARIAPRSRLRLENASHERVVSIQGRVFFAVAKDPARPFRVRTSEGDVVALGTRFDVRTERRELRLAVLEGRVALISGGAQTELAMGEVGGLRDGVPIPVVKLRSPEEVTSWMKKFLAFRATPLITVAAEIQRVYGRRVTITDPTLGNETVTATFTDESLEGVVNVVCTVVGVQCAVSESQITISRH
jgi:transmembrane sensor